LSATGGKSACQSVCIKNVIKNNIYSLPFLKNLLCLSRSTYKGEKYDLDNFGTDIGYRIVRVQWQTGKTGSKEGVCEI
jgi:hypothetical protein